MKRALIIFLLTTSFMPLVYGQQKPLTKEMYEKSLAVFEEGKKEHNNTYQFAVTTASWAGWYSKTTFFVENGIVTKRGFEAGRHGTPDTKWIEKGDKLGSHSEGEALMTMEAIYTKAKGFVRGKTEENEPENEESTLAEPSNNEKEGKLDQVQLEHIKVAFYYGFDLNGIFNLVGTRPVDCLDDCFNGYRILDFKWGTK